VGPLTALTALQLAIAVSSRVSDPRSAQQISAIVVLPIAAILIGQITGVFIIGTAMLLLAALGLLAIWLVVATFSVALFQRETILTRWK
jgi:ABC-2 type transport system permease protein